jgi:hypothetical protein
VLIVAEQGHGDTIQFLRFLRHPALAGKVAGLAAAPRQHRLLRHNFPDLTLSPRTDPAPPSGTVAWEALMSLPYRLGMPNSSLGMSEPYLRPEPELARRMQAALGGDRRLRVGIVWQGNPGLAADKARSLSVEAFRPLAEIPGVRLVALQKFAGLAQLDGSGFGDRVSRVPPELDTGDDLFVDTAAAISALDLVIACDTAVAHLAGAMGKPVWILLRLAGDWRWGWHGTTTLWYPSARLFRQPVPGDWASPMAAVAAALRAAAARHAW